MKSLSKSLNEAIQSDIAKLKVGDYITGVDRYGNYQNYYKILYVGTNNSVEHIKKIIDKYKVVNSFRSVEYAKIWFVIRANNKRIYVIDSKDVKWNGTFFEYVEYS